MSSVLVAVRSKDFRHGRFRNREASRVAHNAALKAFEEQFEDEVWSVKWYIGEASDDPARDVVEVRDSRATIDPRYRLVLFGLRPGPEVGVGDAW